MGGFVAVLAAVLVSLAGGCEGGASTRSAALGESFVLKVGESVAIAGEGRSLGFEGVLADSRCPTDVTCVWEGDATVRVWLRAEGGEKTFHDLHTATPAGEPVVERGLEVRLLRLDPAPVSTRRLAPDDYRATLEVVRTSPARATPRAPQR